MSKLSVQYLRHNTQVTRIRIAIDTKIVDINSGKIYQDVADDDHNAQNKLV